jgi:hypothetical protein
MISNRFLPESTESSQESTGQFWAGILLLFPAISGVFLQDPVAEIFDLGTSIESQRMGLVFHDACK